MPLVPFRLTLSFGNTRKVNGRIVGGYRLQFTSIRGLSLQIYSASNFGFGRGLIAASVAKSDNCMIPRGMAVLDTLQYLLFGPISILFNIIAWIFFILGGIFTLPFWCCFPTAIKSFQLLAWVSAMTIPITLLLNIVAFIINPLQIFVPELFALMRYQQWDEGMKTNDLIDALVANYLKQKIYLQNERLFADDIYYLWIHHYQYPNWFLCWSLLSLQNQQGKRLQRKSRFKDGSGLLVDINDSDLRTVYWCHGLCSWSQKLIKINLNEHA